MNESGTARAVRLVTVHQQTPGSLRCTAIKSNMSHGLLGSMDTTDKYFVEAEGGLMNHLGVHRLGCLNQLLPIPSADIGPLVTVTAMLDRAENTGGFG